MNGTNPRTQEIQWIPNRINKKKSSLAVKMNTKDNKKILKTVSDEIQSRVIGDHKNKV